MSSYYLVNSKNKKEICEKQTYAQIKGIIDIWLFPLSIKVFTIKTSCALNTVGLLLT